MRDGGARSFVLASFALTLAMFLLFGLMQPALAQGRASGSQSPKPQSGGTGELTLKGCLSGRQFLIVRGSSYRLTGNTSILGPYNGRYVAIHVRKPAKPPFPMVSIPVEFIGLEKVFPQPISKSNAALGDPSRWPEHANEQYGIRFAVPDLFPASQQPTGLVQPEFVNPSGRVTLGHFEVPVKAYRPSNFAGGSFAIFSNPAITNRPSCLQFSNVHPRSISWRTAGGIRYRELSSSGVGAGTGIDFYAFHTFQNGFCYAVVLEFAEVGRETTNTGCMVPVITPRQERDLVQRVLSHVAYFRPRLKLVRRTNSSVPPSVVSFHASLRHAENYPGLRVIPFSWSTRNADYVQLSCLYPPAPRIPMGLHGRELPGERNPHPSIRHCKSFVVDYSPNGSASISFLNWHDHPIRVPVTIIPFSHGAAYPASDKTITVTVSRRNPFPDGVPAKAKNITVVSPVPATGPLIYKQGSQFTIRWTDSRRMDGCINLYLVQDRGEPRPYYLTQIGGCISGSFTWTIPRRYAGSGFRIFLSTPGSSKALTAPFQIVP